MRTRSKSLALALVWSCALALPQPAASAAAAEAVRAVEVVGTMFWITAADGRMLTGAGLVGAVLTLDDPNGNQLSVRIDAVRSDARDPTGETFLYTFMARNRASGAWANLCTPDADGLAAGFPLSGTWTASGEHVASDQAFSLTCTSGALGKCVRMGYRPWQAAQGGAPLRDYHQACVRMVRADYCGDGMGHTRNGTPINVYDRLGIQQADAAPAMRFEAAWSADGAVCVRHVRVAEAGSLEALARSCPGRLAGRVGVACTEEAALRSSATLLMNGSVPPR
jgi:ADYC domain